MTLTKGAQWTAQPTMLRFFLPFAVGFATLIFVGQLAARTNYIEHFQRFHTHINPASLYYPTASQVVTLARHTARPGVVLVVIGGSSVVWGAGQGSTELWSDALKQDLGDGYEVLNLAFPAGSPNEHGAVATEAMIREGRPVIYIADFYITAPPADGLLNRYVFWEAYERDLLLPDDRRDSSLDELPESPAFGVPRDELRLRAKLDRWLAFRDLWNAVTYTAVETVWYPGVPDFPSPRKFRVDPLQVFAPEQVYAGDPSVMMSVLLHEGDLACSRGPAGQRAPKDNTAYWDLYQQQLETALPVNLRPHMIGVFVNRSPYYLDRLSDDDRRCHRQAWDDASRRAQTLGFPTVFFGDDWTAADYVDGVHPNAVGGRRMARGLAAQVRDRAGALGYSTPVSAHVR